MPTLFQLTDPVTDVLFWLLVLPTTIVAFLAAIVQLARSRRWRR